MHALGQRIVRAQYARQFFRQPLDHRHFQAQPAVVDLRRKTRALFCSSASSRSQMSVEAGAQLRRSGRRLQVFDARAAARQQIERQIDAVEIAVVGGAILQHD